MEPPATPPGVTCPWCGSAEVERVGEVGPTVMTSQWICRACRTPFERIRRRGGDPPSEEG
jgi:ring-1,2-phenylacetyl-CoA epoxidase subunit PaaD